MVGVSVVQVANAVRHTPLPSLVSDGPSVDPEDPVKSLENPVTPLHTLGGFVGGGQLAWRAAGPTVEIIEPDRGIRKAAWTFGAVLHNTGAQVTSVCGVGKGPVTHVVVGVDLGADRRPRGLVALLSLRSSRVTRAFHFEHRVTRLCMVSGGELAVDSGTLAPEVRLWQGLLVVGTAHGTLHILDLALDLGGHKVLSDEVSPGTLLAVTTPDPNAEHTRVEALLQHCHPTMCLSDGMSFGGRFQLIGPDDNVLFEAASQQVYVAALAFFPQLASLVVGYNFGAFQIINLSTLTIDCASPYEENIPPVLSFACQEPENDPKNYVYLWLCRSWTALGARESSKTGQGSHALCTMYAMNYDSKVWIEGHGLWYQGLASILPRFEFDILGGLGLRGQPVGPSRVFSALTVQLATPPAAAATGNPSAVGALTAPDEDSGSVLEQSLCLFGWVGGVSEKGCVSLNHYLAVFDINQWYQAQMPTSLKLEESHLCPYMSFHLLDRVPGITADGALSEVVLGAVPKPASWVQHTSHTCNDSDWFPAALSYDAHVLTSDSLVEYRCQSAQQAALAHLTSCGPAAIVNPEDAHAACVFAGLIPSDSHHQVLPTSASSMMLEREALLNVALDQQLVSLLVQCVTEFAEGRFTNLGCSLPSLLDWAWARVTEIKSSNDSLSIPLFDPECSVVSSDNIAMLHQNLTNLITLTTLITTIRDYAHSNLITLQGANELEGRVRVVRLMVLHLEAVLWFYHCGLLSPTPIEDPGDEGCVPFPSELLSWIYKNRRNEIRNLSASLTGNEVLMIDGLLEEAAEGSGGSMGQAWEEEESSNSSSSATNKSGGVYPPPSLHALLNMFLLPYVPTTTKHRIVQYLFLDLASLLSDGYVRVVEELVKYPSSFSLSPSLIKLTQAFWLLDHKDFQEGLNVLLDPLVNPCDITPWQHRRIMKAFLYQGEHGRALTYAKMRQPPKVDLDDIRLHLTLLLANKLVREAFHYQRAHRTTANTEDLLQHFFTGCEQQRRLESVIHLPLSPLEEAALVTYLRTSTSTSAHDYLLVYYLQRARYDDAALLQDGLRGGLGTARRRHGARSALVHGYLTHLPDVASRLSSSAVKRPAPKPVIYKKPPPLSAQIRQSSANIKSRASIIEHQLAPAPTRTDPYTPFKDPAQRRRAYEKTDLDDYDILVTPRHKGSRDASHVVFPLLEGSPTHLLEGETSGLFSPAPAKRSHLAEPSVLWDSLLKTMESLHKRSSIQSTAKPRTSMSQNISADMLSLLQTPKIMRKRRPDSRPGPDCTLADTPQSILKVRQMVQRPLSPSAASDASTPVFPRLSARKAKISAAAAAAVVEESSLNRTVDSSLTPKQLRFHLPKVQPREKLRARGASRLSTGSDQQIEEGEEDEGEEEGVEEEEVEEEEAVEEEEEEAEDTSTPEVEEQTKSIMERSFGFERRQTDLGVPTPRQPLHSPGALPPSWLSPKPQEAMDVQGFVSPEKDESCELPSRDTTLNDMFYSFEEEGETDARGEEEVETATLEKDSSLGKSEEEEELEGIEISREIGETDEDEVNTEDDDKICEEETQEEEKGVDSISNDMSSADRQDTGHISISLVSESINIEERKEEEEEEQQQKQPEPQPSNEETSQRSDGFIFSQSDQHDREADEARAKVLLTNQELLVREEGKAASIDFMTLKEEDYCPEERVEGTLREDEGFSEEIEPPSEEVEAVMEVPSGGQELRDQQEDREKKEVEEEVQVVEAEMEVSSGGQEVQDQQEDREEKEEEVQVVEAEMEVSSGRQEVHDQLEDIEEKEKEKKEAEAEAEEEKEEEKRGTDPTTHATEVPEQKENGFNIEECVSSREDKEEDMDHFITSQEEEMIAEAVSEGDEELCLNLVSDEDEEVIPVISPIKDKSKEPVDREKQVDTQEIGIVKDEEMDEQKGDARDQRTSEAFVDDERSTQSEKDSESLAAEKETTSADTDLTAQENKPTIDGDEEMSVVKKVELSMKENVELQVSVNEDVEHETVQSKVQSEVEQLQKQSDQIFVVEEKYGVALEMEKELKGPEEEKLQRDEAASVSSSTEHKTPFSVASNGIEKAATDVEVMLDNQEQDTVDAVVSSDKSLPVPMNEEAEEMVPSEVDGASPPKKRKIQQSIHEEEISYPLEENAAEVTAEEHMEVREDEKKMDEEVLQKEETLALSEVESESAVAVVLSDREPSLSSLKEEMVVEGLSGSSPAPSLSPRQDSKEPNASDTAQQHRESSVSAGMSPDHTDEASPVALQRRSTRHTPHSPSREPSTTPLRRSRRLSGASTSSAPSTPKRTTRSTTPAREETEERVTRSGRKLLQVPTPLTRSKGSPGSPLVTPRRRTRRTSESEEEMKTVSQKLQLTPESAAEGRNISPSRRQEPSTVSTPSMLPALATPARRSTRKSHAEALETISEDKEVSVKSEGRARTPSKDTTPSKAASRRSRRLSTSESLNTIPENALLTITEDPQTPATPRRSSRRSQSPQGSAESVTTPQRRRGRRRTSSEGLTEEPSQAKTPRRTRQLSGDLTTVTPQRRTPSRKKETHSDTPAKGAIDKGTSLLLEKEGGSVASRTRRRSHSGDNTKEGERGRQGSVTSFVESLSASPTRSTPVTSVKDSESSEEEDRQTRRQRVKQQQQQAKGEDQSTTNQRRSRRFTVVSQPVQKRKSMKVHSLSDEASKFMDLLDTGKTPRHVSRTKRKFQGESSSPVMLLGRKEEEAEVEMESGSGEVNLEAGLDMESESDFESSEGGDRQTSRQRVKQQQQAKEEGKQTTNRRKSRRLIRASAPQSLHVGKSKRKSMKLHTLSDEATKFMDLLDPEKSPQRITRTKRKFQEASSSPVMLLGRKEQEGEVEMESGSEEVNMEAGLGTAGERALENLTNEAVKFLFSSPLAPGRTAKRQSKAEEASSSSESDKVESRPRRAAHKK